MHTTRLVSIGMLLTCFFFTGCVSSKSNKNISDDALAYLDGSNSKRRIEFSGFTWWVKESKNRAGPGPNWWSASKENVWVDERGRLHMKITHRNGKWFCAEIICEEPATYGTYTFHLNGPIDKLDPRVILGLFTWDDTTFKTQANCEIDIEFSQWNDPSAPNLHYSIQPTFGPDDSSGRYKERTHMSHMALENPKSTHTFTWSPDRVTFSSFEGDRKPIKLINNWSFVSDNLPRRTVQEGIISDFIGIPQPGPNTHIRINLWLLDADGDRKTDAPINGKEVEIIVERFEKSSLSLIQKLEVSIL